METDEKKKILTKIDGPDFFSLGQTSYKTELALYRRTSFMQIKMNEATELGRDHLVHSLCGKVISYYMYHHCD